ncbi:MAG: 3-deoxy-D-manno-octulosonic acid transferase [Rhodospirillaceae bacterium]|jgi:3-deoxy-D-manno-octulosonic-acid transferase
MLSLYRFLTDIAAWPLRAFLRVRAWRGKEEPLRLPERRGIPSSKRPLGRLIWCHAASVGEAISVLPIAENLLKDPEVSILVTTGTVTSARILAERLPTRAIHQFAPWDRRAWITRFLDLWQPDLSLRMESELWPNTLLALRERSIPSVIVNARLSEKTFRGWKHFSSFAQDIMDCVDVVLAQSVEFADHFKTLGAKCIKITGNIKLAAAPLPIDTNAHGKLSGMIGSRPVWLAASTHIGEEKICFTAHKRLRDTFPKLLTIITPRHPERGSAISDSAKSHGLNVARRSKNEPITDMTSIYIADTLGELGALFSIAPIVFMGKSLKAHGGQNPIEPCHFDCAIIFGPNMENFKDIAEAMVKEHMALQVNSTESLIAAVSRLLHSPDERQRLSHNAKTITMSADASLEKTCKAISDMVDEQLRIKC